MSFHDTFYDAQSDARAWFVFGCLIERLENLAQLLFIHSFPIVFHLDGE